MGNYDRPLGVKLLDQVYVLHVSDIAMSMQFSPPVVQVTVSR